MKHLLLSLLLFPLAAMGMQIEQHQISAPSALGVFKLLRTEDGFSVLKNNVEHEVKSHDIDPVLKKLTRDQLVTVLAGTRIRVTQFDNEDYKLALAGGLKGGGVGGATFGFYAGKFTVLFLGHGAMQVAALATGPAYFPTLAALEGCFALQLHAASNIVGLAGGIAGAVATGPV